ncbi:MAG: hypothetical protein O3A20_08200 [Planctomycetota bacterium]|nr:hypothetical protein [Planctomycetota bacterium]
MQAAATATARFRLRRIASVLLMAIALFGQGVALPWHLASEHHGHHGHQDLDEHTAASTHEHPNLPVDHDEDDHEYSSVLAASQSRVRVSEPADAAQPIHALPAVSLELCLRSAAREFTWRSRDDSGREAVPLQARGARAPPRADDALRSPCERG